MPTADGARNVMVVAIITVGGKMAQEFMRFDNASNMHDVRELLKTGWVSPRRCTPMVSSLTGEVMTDAEGEPMFTDDTGEPTLLNAQVFQTVTVLRPGMVKFNRLAKPAGVVANGHAPANEAVIEHDAS